MHLLWIIYNILLSGAIVAVAAKKKSKYMFYLLKIACAETVKDYDDIDSFGNNITMETKHLEGL